MRDRPAVLVLGVDPGPFESGVHGWCLYDPVKNAVARSGESDLRTTALLSFSAALVAVETPRPRGAPAYSQLYEAAMAAGWILRGADDVRTPWAACTYSEHARFVAGPGVPSKAALKHALMAEVGPQYVVETVTPAGKRGQPLKPRRVRRPGPTYGVAGHAWDALSVAYWAAHRGLFCRWCACGYVGILDKVCAGEYRCPSCGEAKSL